MLKTAIESKSKGNELDWVLKEMEALEKKENTFLFTDIPEFDRKAWEKILEEKGLQGLS